MVVQQVQLLHVCQQIVPNSRSSCSEASLLSPMADTAEVVLYRDIPFLSPTHHANSIKQVKQYLASILYWDYSKVITFHEIYPSAT